MSKPNINQVKHHYAGVFLVAENGNIIGQLRDDKPGIDNPSKVGPFGGTVEPGESPLQAAWRELTEEETNLKLARNELKLFQEDIAWRELTKEWEVRYFYYAQINNKDLENLEVYEGQGHAAINGPDDDKLIKLCKPVVEKLTQHLNGVSLD